jgi:hypothetical protein
MGGTAAAVWVWVWVRVDVHSAFGCSVALTQLPAGCLPLSSRGWLGRQRRERLTRMTRVIVVEQRRRDRVSRVGALALPNTPRMQVTPRVTRRVRRMQMRMQMGLALPTLLRPNRVRTPKGWP